MKQLSKINQKIVDLAVRIKEIEEYNADDDFDTREKMICANIKTYTWLDEDDVTDEIEKLELSEEATNELIEEFNDNRRSNIYSHACENFVSWIVDELESRVHIENLNQRTNAYYRYVNNLEITGNEKIYLDIHKKEFDKFKKRKHNKRADYLVFIRKQDAFTTNENDRLDCITTEVEVYGRSGGWLSICSEGELENNRFDFYAEDIILKDNDQLNENLLWLGYTSKDKRKLIKEMKYFIDQWQQRFDAIKHFVDRIESAKENFKEQVLEQLRHEINTYIDFNIDFDFDESNCTIAHQGDIIKTSLGVSVPDTEFMNAFAKLMDELKDKLPGETVKFKQKVGNYITEYAKVLENDVIVKAGCHLFSIKQIQSVL